MFKTKNKKINKACPAKPWRSGGFTLIEMLMVLGIMAIMSSIVMFNYPKFQAQIDVRNTANDVALQIVQAQKDATNGKLNSRTLTSWIPSYGVYFNSTVPENKTFKYFADFSPVDKLLTNSTTCDNSSECLNIFSFTRGITISDLKVSCGGVPGSVENLHINFTRPNSFASIRTNLASGCGSSITPADYAQIMAKSPQGLSSNICVYSSGRITINETTC